MKYTKEGYVIIDEINGNKADKDIEYNLVVEAIQKRETSVDLEGIYI